MGTLVVCVPLAAAVNWTVVQHAQRQSNAVFDAGRSAPCSPRTLPAPCLAFAASWHDLVLLAFLGLVQLAIPVCWCLVLRAQ